MLVEYFSQGKKHVQSESQSLINLGNEKHPVRVLHQSPITLKEFSKRYNIDPNPEKMTKFLLEVIQVFDTFGNRQPSNPEVVSNITKLQHLYEVSRQLDASKFEELKDILSTRNNLAEYMAQQGLKDFRTISRTFLFIAFYLRENNSSSKLRKVGGRIEILTTLDAEDAQWVPIQDSTLNDTYIVDQKVLDIAKKYYQDSQIRQWCQQQKPFDETINNQRFLTHDTLNTALLGIADQKALLSSTELIRRKLTILSGEDSQRSGNLGTFGDVYVTAKGITVGFVEPSYFNEYIVSFIIDEEKQYKTLEQLMKEAGLSERKRQKLVKEKLRRLPDADYLDPEEIKKLSPDDLKKVIKDFRQRRRDGVDSFEVPKFVESYYGPEVPLSNIVAVAFPENEIELGRKWVEENLGSDFVVLVREAAELINRSGFQHLFE